MSQFETGFARSLIGGLALSLLTSVVACSGGGGGGDARVVRDFSTCDQHPDSGNKAMADNATKTNWVSSDFFEKPYDRSDLDAVLDASSTSTTQYVQSLGISLFKVARPERAKQCPTYYSVPTASGDQREIWDKKAAGNTANSFLAGLYFEFCGSGPGILGCSARFVVQPTVIVDEASDRWTLIHEMMHHNFNHARKADASMPTSRQIESKIESLTNALENAKRDFNATPNRGDLMRLAVTLKELIATGRELGARRQLEEVAIEGLLIDEWAAGRLRNVSPDSARNGISYMKGSRDIFFETFQSYPSMISWIRKTADAQFWDDVVEVADEMKKDVERTIGEINQKISTAEKKYKETLLALKKANPDQESDLPSDETASFLRATTGATMGATLGGTIETSQEDLEAHLKSHDHDGLSRTYENAVKNLEKLF